MCLELNLSIRNDLKRIFLTSFSASMLVLDLCCVLTTSLSGNIVKILKILPNDLISVRG